MLQLSKRVAYYDLLPPQRSLLEEVLNGLAQPHKQIPPKYFYDGEGCRLFEAICDLPEYYPTRTELAIMRAYAPEMAGHLGPDCAVIEIGCGNSEKTRLLLEALHPLQFMPIDIAQEQLVTSCNSLAQSFPDISMVALRADFARPVVLPAALSADAHRRVLYFPGSTIGNFTPAEARAFLRDWAPQLGRGGGALIGVDMKKDASVLEAAYNDASGVTAAFNLNLLRRLNRELGANFDLDAFRHHAYYNASVGRIEMHLVTDATQNVQIAGRSISFAAGETIHTENSYKYAIAEFHSLARSAGFVPIHRWTDDAQLFSVYYLALPDNR